MKRLFNLTLSIILFSASISLAQIINIPADHSTIQAGIDAASSGDTIMVAPGEYNENLSIEKTIFLTSHYELSGDTAFIGTTIINGSNSSAPAVTIEDNNFPIYPVLQGFTITGGTGRFFSEEVWAGGGIFISANGSIIKNRIINNMLNYPDEFCYGGGIFSNTMGDTVIIKENVIKYNSINARRLGAGAGIFCFGQFEDSKVKIIDNVITNNSTEVFDVSHYIAGGGGIALAQTVKQEIYFAEVVQNVIANNTAPNGGGILVYSWFGIKLKLINNTVINNKATLRGGGLILRNGRVDAANCIFWNNTAQSENNIAIRGELNITYSVTENFFKGEGNIQEDPLLNSEFILSAGSPAIDAGNPGAEFNDMEDENNPGYPLWPAQGELRNDIGYTGGNTEMTLPDSVYNLPEKFLYGEYEEMLYRLAYPVDYDNSQDYPLTVVLHGSDDIGADNEEQMDLGLHWRTNAEYYEHNEFTLVPQYPQTTTHEDDRDNLYNLIQSFKSSLSIDTTKIIFTGWSMGGFSISRFIKEYPRIVCAAIPISGPTFHSEVKHTPFWVFHGTEDVLVPVSGARYTVSKYEDTGIQAVKTEEINQTELDSAIDNGARLLYTEYNGGTHYITSHVFENENIFKWLKNLKKPVVYPNNAWIENLYYKPNIDSVITNMNFDNPENHSVHFTGFIDSYDDTYDADFELFDDGLHNDYTADDGVWGNIFVPFISEDTYRVGVKVNDFDSGRDFHFQDLVRFTTKGPLSYVSHEIKSSVGLRRRFSLTLKNEGISGTIHDVNLKFIFPDSSLIMNTTTGVPVFGDIAPGENLTNSSRDFAFSFADSSEQGLYEIGLEISSNGVVFWNDTFMFDYVTGIEEESDLPTKFALEQNYPNPFNPATVIQYSIPANKKSPPGRGFRGGLINVQLKIYNVLGKEVATLVNTEQRPGNYEVKWDASGQASGVYFYKLTSGSFSEVKKMALVK